MRSFLTFILASVVAIASAEDLDSKDAGDEEVQLLRTQFSSKIHAMHVIRTVTSSRDLPKTDELGPLRGLIDKRSFAFEDAHKIVEEAYDGANYRRFRQEMFQTFLSNGRLIEGCEYAGIDLSTKDRQRVEECKVTADLHDQLERGYSSIACEIIGHVTHRREFDKIFGEPYAVRTDNLRIVSSFDRFEPDTMIVRVVSQPTVQADLELKVSQVKKIDDLAKRYRAKKLVVNVDDAEEFAAATSREESRKQSFQDVEKIVGEEIALRCQQIANQRYAARGAGRYVIDVYGISASKDDRREVKQRAASYNSECNNWRRLKLNQYFQEKLAGIVGKEKIARASGRPSVFMNTYKYDLEPYSTLVNKLANPMSSKKRTRRER